MKSKSKWKSCMGEINKSFKEREVCGLVKFLPKQRNIKCYVCVSYYTDYVLAKRDNYSTHSGRLPLYVVIEVLHLQLVGENNNKLMENLHRVSWTTPSILINNRIFYFGRHYNNNNNCRYNSLNSL